jgi:hypothetical protein
MLAWILVGTSPAPAQATADTSTPWALGTMRVRNWVVNDCPAGFTCFKYLVRDCPQVSEADTGELAYTVPSNPRGVVTFFRGGGGSKWWAESQSGDDFLARLRDNDGFEVIQIRWVKTGWLDAADGETTAGPARLACRAATLTQWIYDHIYVPLGLNPGPGQCGFCITGNSAGASEVAYMPGYYGMDSIIDAAIPSGGPDHSAITKGCLQASGYEFNEPHRNTIDLSYGWLDGSVDPGPCNLEDPTWAPTWDADSVDTGSNDYSFPTMRVEFIIGGLDDTGAPPHAAAWRDRLLENPENSVTWTFIPDMPHHIENNAEGQDAIEAALLKTL